MKALSTAASTVRHTFGVAFEALLILAIVGALVFGAALLTGIQPAGADSVFAAKGGNGGGHGGGAATAPAISVPDAVYGGTTTATVATGGADVYVLARCYTPDLSGAYVYAAYFPVDSDNQAVVGPLWSTLWPNSGAACVADEGYVTRDGFGKWVVMASTNFNVAAAP